MTDQVIQDVLNTIETTEVSQTTEAAVEAEKVETPQAQEETSQAAEPSELEMAQKKIQRQRKALQDAQRKIQELSALKAEVEKLKAQTVKEPKIDDFDTTDEYLERKAEYLADQKAKAKMQEAIQNQEANLSTQAVQERDRAFQMAEFEYYKANPAYENSKAEVRNFVQEIGLPPNHPTLQAVFEVADATNSGPQLIDYFGKDGGRNLAELERILSLSPIVAAAEVAKLQTKLSSPEKTPNTLPKPIKPVSGAAKPQKTTDDLSGEELLKKFKIKY